MTVCVGMLVKDEADIISTTIAHLLPQVDEIIVLDNLSSDGTREILEQLPVEIRDDTEVGYFQAAKMTALAQEALQRGHGWFIPIDADELWIAGDGRRIADFLDGVSLDAIFVKASILNHVATANDSELEQNPVRRLGWRQRQPLAYQWWKVACRCRADLEIAMGNHSARTHGPGREETGLEIRHFPYRSAAQFVRKAENGLAAYRAAPDLMNAGYGAHWKAYGEAVEQNGAAAGESWFYEAFFVPNPDRDQSLVLDPAPVWAWPEEQAPTAIAAAYGARPENEKAKEISMDEFETQGDGETGSDGESGAVEHIEGQEEIETGDAGAADSAEDAAGDGESESGAADDGADASVDGAADDAGDGDGAEDGAEEGSEGSEGSE